MRVFDVVVALTRAKAGASMGWSPCVRVCWASWSTGAMLLLASICAFASVRWRAVPLVRLCVGALGRWLFGKLP
eukprot:1204208-Alexandrium_andersonii.AAC.1